YPLPTDYGEQLAKHLHLYAKEQQLYCFAFFLTGKTKILGKCRPVCAPLYLIPATLLYENDIYQISLDFSQVLLNPAFAEVQEVTQTSEYANAYELLNKQLPQAAIGFDELFQINKVLKTVFPELKMDDFDSFPMRVKADALRPKTRGNTGGFQLWPTLGIGVMDKAAGSLGILNELETLSIESQFSPVLNYLFTNNEIKSKAADDTITPLPVSLSQNQQKILKSVSHQVLTMVNGPPGTGKSFTIAAIAADRLSKGESVLIATKNPQAVEVIADKLEHDLQLPQIAVRASRKNYRKHLRKRLKDWLYGLGFKPVNKPQILLKKLELKTTAKEIDRLKEMTLLRSEYEQRHGLKILTAQKNWWHRLREWYLKQRLSGIMPVWELFNQLDIQLKKEHRLAKEHLEMLFYRRLSKAFSIYRTDLQAMLNALKSNTGNQKEHHFNQVNFNKVLSALPIWLVDTAHIHQVLPLTQGLFDVVIIDEASQADIASTLPLLQRAKRAVIVGDPKQLRHVSFLSRDRQQTFMSDQLRAASFQHLLSYRDNSILDLVFGRIQQQEQVFLLNEHYRSLPDIISFSNEQFYRSALHIMTSTPCRNKRLGLQFNHVEGERNEKGQNPKEATAIMQAVVTIMEKESDLPKGLCQSIGIISPFRAQVEHFKRLIKAVFTNEQIRRHRLIVGTAHDFQGEERDVIFNSWVVDAQTPKGVFTYLNKEDVFNVSITRARGLQQNYISALPEQLPSGSLLRAYINTNVTHQEQSMEEPIADVFLEEVRGFLQELEVDEILVGYSIAGVNIDLVFVHKGETYCIDLIGYPGHYGHALSVDQWKTLSRVGVSATAFSYSYWHYERAACEAVLAGFIGAYVNEEANQYQLL
ncbi:MAG: ATP-binding protein, partial [Bacteroidota bacterium]